MINGLKPGSKFDRVMRILQEGPSTTNEIAAEMEIHANHASALLCDMRKRGYAHGTKHGDTRVTLWHPSKVHRAPKGGTHVAE